MYSLKTSTPTFYQHGDIAISPLYIHQITELSFTSVNTQLQGCTCHNLFQVIFYLAANLPFLFE